MNWREQPNRLKIELWKQMREEFPFAWSKHLVDDYVSFILIHVGTSSHFHDAMQLMRPFVVVMVHKESTNKGYGRADEHNNERRKI